MLCILAACTGLPFQTAHNEHELQCLQCYNVLLYVCFVMRNQPLQGKVQTMPQALYLCMMIASHTHVCVIQSSTLNLHGNPCWRAVQCLQGKTVDQPRHSPDAGPDDTQESGPFDLNPRPSFENRAQAVQCDLSAAITPAIERMLQVRLLLVLSMQWTVWDPMHVTLVVVDLLFKVWHNQLAPSKKH